MKRIFPFLPISVAAVLLLLAPGLSSAQQSLALTWDQVKAKFEAANPALRADALGVDEMKAAEITAFLRPNPTASFTMDQLYPFGAHYDPNVPGVRNRPLSNALTTGSVSYLYEREHKRDLRLESAKEGTQIAGLQHQDLERNLLFNLRAAFVDTLQAKAVLDLARADLEYYDKIIAISRNRLRAGDIAQIDLDRIELLRVQYEVEIQNAIVNLRTSKIQLLQLLNERTPVEQFDVTGPFDFSDDLKPLEDFRQVALDERPDLRAALESIQQAQTNRKLAQANGSADPTFSVDSGANPPLDPYVGFNISIPLRIFDRNQGNKETARYQADASRLTETAARYQVISDVDQAWVGYVQAKRLSDRFGEHYLDESRDVLSIAQYAFEHGGIALIDYLDALRDARSTTSDALNAYQQTWLAIHQLSAASASEIVP